MRASEPATLVLVPSRAQGIQYTAKRAWIVARRQPLGAAGVVILVLVILAAVFARYITDYGPIELTDAPLLAPSAQHLMGTDNYGRDVFSRVVYGSRISLTVGLISVGISKILGVTLGILSGYFGGRWVDTIIQRIMDSLMSLPLLVLAIGIMAVLGPSIHNVMIAIGIVSTPGTSRVARGATLSVLQNQYIEAAHASGCGALRIMARHVLPNILAPIIILATLSLGNAITIEATLSFLGYGTPLPHPSWGAMLSQEGRAYMEVAPWLALFPGVALSLTILAFNLAGDSLRDIWDPRMRGGGGRLGRETP